MFAQLKRLLTGAGAVSSNASERAVDELLAKLMELPEVKHDFTTPEGAIVCLEDAFRNKDIDAAVAAIDFKAQARLTLSGSGFTGAIDDETLVRFARALEEGFRKQTLQKWPQLADQTSFFPKRTDLHNGIVEVTEVRRLPNGRFTRQEALAIETENGWRVVQRLSMQNGPALSGFPALTENPSAPQSGGYTPHSKTSRAI